MIRRQLSFLSLLQHSKKLHFSDSFIYLCCMDTAYYQLLQAAIVFVSWNMSNSHSPVVISLLLPQLCNLHILPTVITCYWSDKVKGWTTQKNWGLFPGRARDFHSPQALSPHVMRPGPEVGHPPQSNDTVKELLEIYFHSFLCLWLSTTTRKRRALREVCREQIHSHSKQ